MIKEAIDNIIKELDLKLEGDDRYEVAAGLVEHFQQIILDTVLANLETNQLEEFKNLVEQDDLEKMDEGITNLVASIPGINFKIEEALQLEMESIKRSKAIMDK